MPITRKPPPRPIPGPRPRTILRATIAFHESGHTVAAMVLHPRKAIEFVTINGPRELPGYVLSRRRRRLRLSPNSPAHVKRAAHKDITSLHAGTWSHLHFENALNKMRGRPTRPYKHAVMGDILEAIELAGKICRTEAQVERLNDRLGQKARGIVEECWPQVVAIARALIDQGTIDRDELWRIARTPDPDANPWDAFDDLVLSLKLPKGENERLRAMIAARHAKRT